MPDKNNRVLLCLNTCPFKFSKKCKCDGKKSKYSGNMCNFHPLKTKTPKIQFGYFSGLKFFVGHTVRQLTKFTGHFRNLPVMSDRPMVFAKTVTQ